MFREQAGQQDTSRLMIPEGRVHFAVSEKRKAMQVARANSAPCAINQHEFGMNPDRVSLAIVSRSSKASQGEMVEGSKFRQGLRDRAFSRHHGDNFHPTQQH